MKPFNVFIYGIDTHYEGLEEFINDKNNYYDDFINLIEYEVHKGNLNVLGFVDINPYYKTIDNLPVIDINDINNYDYQYIIIASGDKYRESVKKIQQYNIPREKCININVLKIPHFDFNQYIQLRNSNLSIISNNCWGGFTLNSLDFKFRTPFVNLYMGSTDYLKMLKKLKLYLSYPLELEKMVNIDKKHQHPICRLNDVLLYCNHCETFEEAKKLWDQRLQRINYENLLLMFFTEERKEAEEFDKLEYKNKICFTSFDSDLESIIPLDIFNFTEIYTKSNGAFWQIVNANAQGKILLNYNLFNILLNINPKRRTKVIENNNVPPKMEIKNNKLNLFFRISSQIKNYILNKFKNLKGDLND